MEEGHGEPARSSWGDPEAGSLCLCICLSDLSVGLVTGPGAEGGLGCRHTTQGVFCGVSVSLLPAEWWAGA